jgi:hypothetical protein
MIRPLVTDNSFSPPLYADVTETNKKLGLLSHGSEFSAALPAAARRLGVRLCACDRAGRQPRCPLPPPAPSPLQRKGLAEEPLTAKLDVIAEFAGKFPAEA